MKFMKKSSPAIILLVLILSIWQIYLTIFDVRQTVLPPPSKVLQALFEYREIIWSHAVQTIFETMAGFALAILLGLAIAAAMFLSPFIRRAFYPLLTISQTIPIIALAPLLIIWFGFGSFPKVMLVAIFCLFPIAVTTADGLINTPKHLSDYMTSLGASRLQTLRYLNAPYALDRFFSGLKIAAVYAVTAAVIGEYVGGFKGLGIYLQTSANSRATAVVFATSLVIIGLSLGLLGLVVLAQKKLMPWKRINAKV